MSWSAALDQRKARWPRARARFRSFDRARVVVDEGVDARHLVAVGEQDFGEVGADEARRRR